MEILQADVSSFFLQSAKAALSASLLLIFPVAAPPTPFSLNERAPQVLIHFPIGLGADGIS
jgi:hypothetical protein